MKVFGLVALVSIGLSSCGDKKKDYSGMVGTCNSTVAELGTTCVEYSYSAKDQKEDPKAKVKSQLQSGCTDTQGTWSDLTTCSTTGLIGTCTISSTREETGITAKVNYYTGGIMTTDLARTNCTSDNGGTFTEP